MKNGSQAAVIIRIALAVAISQARLDARRNGTPGWI
jgi:hypothetical protein